MAGVLRAFPARKPLAGAGLDEPLVAAAQADPSAFGALYQHYLPGVYRYLAAKAGNPEEAADLTQAVFLKAFTSIQAFKPGTTPFVSWLFRIARNTAVDAHRKRRPVLAWEFAPDMPGDPDDSPELALLRAERLRELRSRLAQLEPARRDLLALRYAGGLTAAEIAPLVGKSPDAVKKQLQRTLQTLKEHYRDQHE